MLKICLVIPLFLVAASVNAKQSIGNQPVEDVIAPTIRITRDSGPFPLSVDKVFAFVRVEDNLSLFKVTYEVRHQTSDALLLSGDIELGPSGQAILETHIGIEATVLPKGADYIRFVAYDGADSPNISLPALYAFGINQ